MNILHHRTATSCQNRRGKDESPGCSACSSSDVVNRIARGGCIFSQIHSLVGWTRWQRTRERDCFCNYNYIEERGCENNKSLFASFCFRLETATKQDERRTRRQRSIWGWFCCCGWSHACRTHWNRTISSSQCRNQMKCKLLISTAFQLNMNAGVLICSICDVRLLWVGGMEQDELLNNQYQYYFTETFILSFSPRWLWLLFIRSKTPSFIKILLFVLFNFLCSSCA